MIPNKNSSTKSIAVLVTTAAATLPLGGGLTLSLFNRGTGDVFIELGNSANVSAVVPTANTGGGMLIAANAPSVEVMLTASDTHIATIGTASATVYMTRGRDM